MVMRVSLQKLAARLSTRDLEMLLKLKQNEGKLAGLRKKRDKIVNAIAKIDRDIAAVAGSPVPVKRGRKPGAKKRGRPAGKKRGRPAASKVKAPVRGRRPKGRAGNLPAMLQAVMERHGRPIGLGEAVKALAAAGYKSKSSAAILRKMVSMTCRRRSDLFARASKGMYRLA